MKNKYDDIINLPRHVSKKRPPMPIKDRAAQFAPFAALTGHDAAVKETERITETKIELSQYMKEILNQKLQILAKSLKDKPKIKITYFKPDENKDGGSYITASGTIKRIDEHKQIISMTDSTQIPVNEIIDIQGDIF